MSPVLPFERGRAGIGLRKATCLVCGGAIRPNLPSIAYDGARRQVVLHWECAGAAGRDLLDAVGGFHVPMAAETGESGDC